MGNSSLLDELSTSEQYSKPESLDWLHRLHSRQFSTSNQCPSLPDSNLGPPYSLLCPNVTPSSQLPNLFPDAEFLNMTTSSSPVSSFFIILLRYSHSLSQLIFSNPPHHHPNPLFTTGAGELSPVHQPSVHPTTHTFTTHTPSIPITATSPWLSACAMAVRKQRVIERQACSAPPPTYSIPPIPPRPSAPQTSLLPPIPARPSPLPFPKPPLPPPPTQPTPCSELTSSDSALSSTSSLGTEATPRSSSVPTPPISPPTPLKPSHAPLEATPADICSNDDVTIKVPEAAEALSRAGEGVFVASYDGMNDCMDIDNPQGANHLYFPLFITLICLS
jgi:hypothetical protein